MEGEWVRRQNNAEGSWHPASGTPSTDSVFPPLQTEPTSLGFGLSMFPWHKIERSGITRAAGNLLANCIAATKKKYDRKLHGESARGDWLFPLAIIERSGYLALKAPPKRKDTLSRVFLFGGVTRI